MSERLREYAEAIVGAVDKVDADGLVSYALDTTRFGCGLKEIYELSVAYLAEHPTSQPITADWLRENDFTDLINLWRLWLDDDRFIDLHHFDGSGVDVCYCNLVDGEVKAFVRRVTDTADLANLVAALRGGAR